MENLYGTIKNKKVLKYLDHRDWAGVIIRTFIRA